MKIIGQTIPSEMAAAYKKLVANKPPAAGGLIIARTTKKARAGKPKKPKRLNLMQYEDAVDFLIAYLTKKDGHPPAPDFRAAQITALKNGYFDPTYWMQCTIDSEQALINYPTSAPWSAPRAYAYPDPANLPSATTYGAGTNSSGAPAYAGQTQTGRFVDTYLKWKRIVFSLANSFARTSKEPIFLKFVGSITASGNFRPSRTMLSAIAKQWIVLPGSTRLTTTDAPVFKPRQVYWRYRVPRGVPPYFNLSHQLSVVMNMRSSARDSLALGGEYRYEESPGDLTKCVVLIAPMPMMGKRYNNNTSINTTLSATLELWQIKKTGCTYALPIRWDTSNAIRWWKNDVYADGWATTPFGVAFATTSASKIALVGTDGKLYFSDLALTTFTELVALTDINWPIIKSMKTPTGWVATAMQAINSTQLKSYFLNDDGSIINSATGADTEPSVATLGRSHATNGYHWFWQSGTDSFWLLSNGTIANQTNLGSFPFPQQLVKTNAGIFFKRRRNARGQQGQDIAIQGIVFFGWGSVTQIDIPGLDITASGLYGDLIGVVDAYDVITIGCTPGDIGTRRLATGGENLTLASPDYGIAACADGFLIFTAAAVFRYKISLEQWSCYSLTSSAILLQGQSFCETLEPPPLTDSTPPGDGD